MNDENNIPEMPAAQSLGQDVLVGELNRLTQHYSKKMTLSELQLVVERITFGLTMKSTPKTPEELLQNVHVLLADDVSVEMLAFVDWVIDQQSVGSLQAEAGRAFLNHTIQYLHSIEEIIVATPVALGDSHRRRVVTNLRAVHPDPARIIFETKPSLLLGCTISAGNTVYDYSLVHSANNRMKEYVTRDAQEFAHG